MGRLGHSFAALKERNFRYVILSTISLSFGQWFQQVGLAWLVFELTGSASQLGAISGVQGLVFLLMSPLAGILSDRLNRRRLLIATTGISAIQSLALAVLVASARVEVWHLYVFSLVGGAAMAFSQPVRQAFVFDVVGREGIARAVPVNSFAQNLARIVAPAAAGMIIGFAGTASVFYGVALLTLLAVGFTMLIGATNQLKLDMKDSPWRTLSGGLRYSLSNPTILGLLVLAMIPTLMIFPYVGFLPFFAAKLHGGAQGYGVLATGAGWGSLVGLFALMFVGEVKHKGKVMLLAQGLYPVAVALFSLSSNFVAAMAFLVVAGVFFSISTTLQNTMILVSAREDMRGRVMALYAMASGLQPIGSLTMGVAIATWGPSEAVFGYMMVATALGVIAAFTFGSVRRA